MYCLRLRNGTWRAVGSRHLAAESQKWNGLCCNYQHITRTFSACGHEVIVRMSREDIVTGLNVSPAGKEFYHSRNVKRMKRTNISTNTFSSHVRFEAHSYWLLCLPTCHVPRGLDISYHVLTSSLNGPEYAQSKQKNKISKCFNEFMDVVSVHSGSQLILSTRRCWRVCQHQKFQSISKSKEFLKGDLSLHAPSKLNSKATESYPFWNGTPYVLTWVSSEKHMG